MINQFKIYNKFGKLLKQNMVLNEILLLQYIYKWEMFIKKCLKCKKHYKINLNHYNYIAKYKILM